MRLSNSGGITVAMDGQSAPQPPQMTSPSAVGFWMVVVVGVGQRVEGDLEAGLLPALGLRAAAALSAVGVPPG